MNVAMTYRFALCVSVSFVLPLCLAGDAPVTYDKAQVWRTRLRNVKDLRQFKKIRGDGRVSLWYLGNMRADYLVLDKHCSKVEKMLRDIQLNHTVIIKNVQRTIEESKATSVPWNEMSLRVGHRLDFHSYPSVQIINEYLDYLKDYYPSILKIHRIGSTVENRPINMIHISNGNPRNKNVVLIAGQHAREWIGITSALFVANNIASNFDKQPYSMKNMDWYIVPLVNPDGFEYSQKIDRLWRKNRRMHMESKCRGVDLNRNFPKHWRLKDVTVDNPCEEDYAGLSALSEPETRSLQNMMESFGNKTPVFVLDFHSYGQMIIYPWGVKHKQSENIVSLVSNAEIMKSAILKATGRKYKHGTPSQMLYSVSGTALDWFHSKGVPLSYSIESRDTGRHGFLLPANQIIGAGKEMLAVVRALAKNQGLNHLSVMRSDQKREWF